MELLIGESFQVARDTFHFTFPPISASVPGLHGPLGSLRRCMNELSTMVVMVL